MNHVKNLRPRFVLPLTAVLFIFSISLLFVATILLPAAAPTPVAQENQAAGDNAGSVGDQRAGEANGHELPETERVRFDGHKVVRVNITTMRELMTMMSLSDDPWSESIGIGLVDFRVEPQAFEALKQTGIEFEVLIEDVQQLVDAERLRIERHQQEAAAGTNWFEEYKTMAEVDAYIDELAALNPDIVEVFEIGESIHGYMVRGLRISATADGVAADEKPAMLFHGCQHAREWISVMVTVYLADALMREYGVDPELTALVDRMTFYIIPVVNPDGYIYSWDVNRMWRKNRRNNGDGSWGVDPNRNWSYEWGGAGSSGNPSSQIYRGTAPHSEPEIANLANFMLERPNLVAYIDIHSYSQLILAPWGYTTNLPPDHDTFQYLGQEQADRIYEVHGKTYIHGPAGPTLYLASGIASDWAYGELGIWGFTYELRDTGQYGFLLPADQIIPNCEEILPAVTFLADWSSSSVRFEFPDDVPEVIEPEQPVTFDVLITPVNENVLPGSEKLRYRINGGEFTTVNLTHIDGELYEGTLPAIACEDELEFYLEAMGDGGTLATSPTGAPLAVYEAIAGELDIIEVLYANFNTGLPSGWSATGLWHTTESCPVSGPCDGPRWAYYGVSNNNQCTYNSGGANSGQMTTSPIQVPEAPTGSAITLSFCYNLITEDHENYDIATFGIVGGWSTRMPESPQWSTFTLDLTPYAGQQVQLYWHFDTIDGWFNNYRGWQVDAVEITVSEVICEEVCKTADLNCDGVVDGADLGILLANWGDCDECNDCIGDINGDCTVDGADLGILLANWG